MIGRSLDAQIEEQRRWAAEVRAQATLNVERALSVNARSLPQYLDLVDLESAHVEASLLGDACPEHKLRDLLGAGRRVLEATFRAIARPVILLATSGGAFTPRVDLSRIVTTLAESTKHLRRRRASAFRSRRPWPQ